MSLDISLISSTGEYLADKNITHNLAKMWKKAGVYDSLYSSDKKTAKEVLPILKKGLIKMIDNPEKYKQFNSPNGWGTYKDALPWLMELIVEFEKNPDGVIEISK